MAEGAVMPLTEFFAYVADAHRRLAFRMPPEIAESWRQRLDMLAGTLRDDETGHVYETGTYLDVLHECIVAHVAALEERSPRCTTARALEREGRDCAAVRALLDEWELQRAAMLLVGGDA